MLLVIGRSLMNISIPLEKMEKEKGKKGDVKEVGKAEENHDLDGLGLNESV